MGGLWQRVGESLTEVVGCHNSKKRRGRGGRLRLKGTFAVVDKTGGASGGKSENLSGGWKRGRGNESAPARPELN